LVTIARLHGQNKRRALSEFLQSLVLKHYRGGHPVPRAQLFVFSHTTAAYKYTLTYS